MSVGSFEQVVMLAVLRLEDRAYGMAIRREIAERTGRNASLGAVYATLDRLCVKGYLRVDSGPGGQGRRGRPRKFFRLTTAGKGALEGSLEAIDRMLSGISRRRLKRSFG